MRLIDADDFKARILDGTYIFCQENKEDIARAIDDEPTVEPERNKGEWIEHYSKELTYLGFSEFHTYYICSQCKIVIKNMYDFCPHCGADMRGDNNENSNQDTV